MFAYVVFLLLQSICINALNVQSPALKTLSGEIGWPKLPRDVEDIQGTHSLMEKHNKGAYIANGPFGKAETVIPSNDPNYGKQGSKEHEYCQNKYGKGVVYGRPLPYTLNGSVPEDARGTCNPAFKKECEAKLNFEKSRVPTCFTDKWGNCKGSFLADPPSAGTVDSVCYEAAPDAPFGYLEGMYWAIKGTDISSHMYELAVIDYGLSCAERGYVFNKLVHPCFQHAYSVYKSLETQVKYETYRQRLYDDGKLGNMALPREQPLLNIPGKPKSSDVTAGMAFGNCNTCA